MKTTCSIGKQRKRRALAVRLTACATALALALLVLPGGSQRAEAASEDELRQQIESLQQQADAAQASQDELEADLEAIQGQLAKATEQKVLMDRQLAAIDQQIAATEQQIAYYDQLIAQEEANLAEAQAREAEQYELFCKRVRAMEEQGTVSYWSILFSAESFSDMLDLYTIVSDTIAYDNAVIDQLAAARQAVADTLESLNASQEEQNAKKAELDQQYAAQEKKVNEAWAVMREYESAEATALEAIDREAAAAEAIERQIQAAEAELAEYIRQQNIATGTGYVWPVRGCYTLTSAYGYRTHPVTGQPYKLHNGLDIAAPKNTPIHAVKGGVVSISGWDNSYGNYVVVQHGDGNSSLYAHMNSRAVKKGDTVAQDEVIGYVGTTGSSTGYHLHLEIRIGGSRVDPHDIYVGSVSFTYASTYNRNAVKP